MTSSGLANCAETGAANANMGQNFGRIGAIVNGKAPFDATMAADSAEVVAFMSMLPWPGFMPETDKGGNTRPSPRSGPVRPNSRKTTRS